MKMLHHHCHLLLLILLPLMVEINGFSSSKIMPCSQTPYPEVCFHFINKSDYEALANSDETSQITQFLDLAIRVSLTQAILAHSHLLSATDLTYDDDRAKSAWVDCLELYEDSVDLLSKSTFSSTIFNPSDLLTRLSASIANHQTCQNGFHDFGFSSDHNFHQILSNFSKLVSNSLAITKAAAAVAASATSSSSAGWQWLSDENGEVYQGLAGSVTRKADIVVAQDGTGHYRTISEAVAAATAAVSAKVRKGRNERFVIYVKGGVYRENVVIEKKMKNLMMIGDGIDSTIVTAGKNVHDGSTTFRSATFAVAGDGFVARDITFENTAGPQKHQAVALRSSADHSVFYRCSFKGYQDTLYAHSKRQFYRECDIYGTVDFIFGDAIAVFQNCNIYVRKPMRNQKNTITAQARSDPNENTGFVIQNSVVRAAPDLKPVERWYETYLGRPWKAYSRTVIMKSFLDGLVAPAGWLPWDGKFGLNTLYYGEFMNTGGGGNTSGRVRWPGFHLITRVVEAGRFTVNNFLGGESWIPATGVPFIDGL